MRHLWSRRRLLGMLAAAGAVGVSGCGGEDNRGPAATPTTTETAPPAGTPTPTTIVEEYLENRTEVSWLVEPRPLFSRQDYGAYVYDIPQLREHSATLHGQPLEALDLTSEDLSLLGIAPAQLDSFMKIDGITRSEAEILLFFGSFDDSTQPSDDGGTIVSTSQYADHTLYRISGSGGDIAIAVGSDTIILATDTPEKDPMATAKSPIEANRGDTPRYQDVHSGFADMLAVLWDGAITAVGTHEEWRNSVRANPALTAPGSVGLGGSVRLGSETSDIRVAVLYPSVEEAKSRRESISRRARKSDEVHSSWVERRGRLVVLTAKRPTAELIVGETQ